MAEKLTEALFLPFFLSSTSDNFHSQAATFPGVAWKQKFE